MKKIKTLLSSIALATALTFGQTQSVEAQTQDNKSKILFTEYNYQRPTNAQTRLWVLNPDGSGLKKLTDSVSYFSNVVSAASFNPDGNMITYANTNGKHKIIDLDGKELYSFDQKNRSYQDFTWAPDGKSVLFGSYGEGLYKFDLDKNEVTRIMNTIGYTYDHNPVMSPDLEKIIYTHHEYGGTYYNYIMDATDATNKKLVSNSFGQDTVYTNYDEQLNNTWMDNSNILFKVLNKNVIGYYNVDSLNGKVFFTDVNFSSMKVSKDKKSIALISSYNTLKFVDVESLNSDSLKINNTDISATNMAYSSDDKIFCINKPEFNSGIYEEGEQGLYSYDENMKRHSLLNTKNSSDSINIIQFIEWNSKPVKTSDLGLLNPIKYSHTLSGVASSTLPKSIKDGTQIYVSQAPGDTLWASTSAGTFTVDWKSLNREQEVNIGSKNVPGHMPNEISAKVKDYNYVTIKFNGLKYSLNLPVHVQNQNLANMSGASISGGDSTVITLNDGKANVIKNNIVTDGNNLPKDNYVFWLKITHPKIQTKNQSVDAKVGMNPELQLNVIQEFEQWLHGENTSPDGTTVYAWLNGQIVHYGTVANNTYITNKVKRTIEPFPVDSVTFRHYGYKNVTKPGIKLVDGGNTENAILMKEFIQWLYGNNSSPEGTTVSAWSNGEIVQTGVVKNKSYATNKIARTENPFILDSLVFNHPGYTGLKKSDVSMIEGANNQEVTLIREVVTNIQSIESTLKNYPNPFNESTIISYNLPSNVNVRLEIYNNLGQKISDMEEKNQQAGLQQIRVDGTNLKSGVYLYKLHLGDNVAIGKIIKQ